MCENRRAPFLLLIERQFLSALSSSSVLCERNSAALSSLSPLSSPLISSTFLLLLRPPRPPLPASVLKGPSCREVRGEYKGNISKKWAGIERQIGKFWRQSRVLWRLFSQVSEEPFLAQAHTMYSTAVEEREEDERK